MNMRIGRIWICMVMCVAATTASEAEDLLIKLNEDAVNQGPPNFMRHTMKGNAPRGNMAQLYKSDRRVTIADIKELTRRSTDIVVGWSMGNRSPYSESADTAYIAHRIQVQTVIKGTIPSGSAIELIMPGGAWIRPDGTRVFMHASDARPVRDGVSYILFLRRKDDVAGDQWMPSAGIQSLYEIEPDTESIIPCDLLESDPVVAKYKNASVGEFMEELISAVASERTRRGKDESRKP